MIFIFRYFSSCPSLSHGFQYQNSIMRDTVIIHHCSIIAFIISQRPDQFKLFLSALSFFHVISIDPSICQFLLSYCSL